MSLAPDRLSPTVLTMLAAVVGCDGVPCRSQSECPVGMFCAPVQGYCDYECLSAADCAAPRQPGRRAICTNEGRCATTGRPPRLLVEEPAQRAVFPFSTRSLTVAGRVVAETARVEIAVVTLNASGCAAEALRRLRLDNPRPGEPAELPFTFDDVPVDPGFTTVVVEATAGLARQTYTVDVERTCEGCPVVQIDTPIDASLSEPVVPRLSGRVRPSTSRNLRWRVVDERGQVLDGALPVVVSGDEAVFRLLNVPTFGGRNRLEVVAPAAGAVEGSCATTVLAPPTRERSFKAVLTWDNARSDLDLVLVGPSGTLGGPDGALSASRFGSALPGRVLDDFDGRGPEILVADPLADGVYGLAVEALTDGEDSGSSAIVRAAWEDQLLTARPLGPRFLSASRGDLWLVGVVQIEDARARFRQIDAVIPFDAPSTRLPPKEW